MRFCCRVPGRPDAVKQTGKAKVKVKVVCCRWRPRTRRTVAFGGRPSARGDLDGRLFWVDRTIAAVCRAAEWRPTAARLVGVRTG